MYVHVCAATLLIGATRGYICGCQRLQCRMNATQDSPQPTPYIGIDNNSHWIHTRRTIERKDPLETIFVFYRSAKPKCLQPHSHSEFGGVYSTRNRTRSSQILLCHIGERRLAANVYARQRQKKMAPKPALRQWAHWVVGNGYFINVHWNEIWCTIIICHLIGPRCFPVRSPWREIIGVSKVNGNIHFGQRWQRCWSWA